MKKMLMAIVAASLLLLGLLVPYSVSASHGSRRTPTPTSSLTTPTSTPTGSQVTPTPTGPQATLTLQASTTPPASATPQPLTIITAGFSCTNGVCTLGPGNVGTFFNEYVTSSGGQGPTPYTWKLVSGSLPSGLSLSNFGVYSAQIAGTPRQTGTSTFTLQVTDGVGIRHLLRERNGGHGLPHELLRRRRCTTLHLVDYLRPASTGLEARIIGSCRALRYPNDSRNLHLHSGSNRQHGNSNDRARQYHHSTVGLGLRHGGAASYL